MPTPLSTCRLAGIDRPLSRICLGVAEFGTRIARDDAFALLDAFAAAGGTFLDSAHIYAAWVPGGAGASERTIGAWIAARGMQRQMVVGTKGGHPEIGSSAIARLRPEDLDQDLAESLERLGQPAIGLYWLHRDDPAIPVEEILDVLERHRRAGRIGAYGASNWTTARLAAAAAAAARGGQAGFVASQIGWSLAEMRPDRIPLPGLCIMDAPTMAWHERSRLPVMPYSSQAGGLFDKPEMNWCYDQPANHRRKALVQAEARRRQVSGTAVALAWLLAHPCLGSAIIGCKNLAHLADSLSAEAITLDPATWAALSSGA